MQQVHRVLHAVEGSLAVDCFDEARLVDCFSRGAMRCDGAMVPVESRKGRALAETAAAPPARAPAYRAGGGRLGRRAAGAGAPTAEEVHLALAAAALLTALGLGRGHRRQAEAVARQREGVVRCGIWS